MACSGERPLDMPVVMVTAERETPGTNARVWASPTHRPSVRRASSSLPVLFPSHCPHRRAAVVNSRAPDTTRGPVLSGFNPVFHHQSQGRRGGSHRQHPPHAPRPAGGS